MISRLGQFYQRVLRDDMATRFGKRVSIQSLEVNIVADSSIFLSGDVRYKAGCFFEMLTGHSPQCFPVDLKAEGLEQAIYGGSVQGRDKDRFRMLKASGQLNNLTATEIKRVASSASGSRLSSTLEKDSMFLFIERIREFYFPDTDFNREEKAVKNPVPKQFQMWSTHSDIRKPSILPIRVSDNPDVATSSLLLNLNDLIKMPEVESYFESLSTILNRQNFNLFLLLRPTMVVESLASSMDEEKYVAMRNFEIMNYLLSALFSPEMKRIRFRPKLPEYPPPRIINLKDINP